VSESVTTGRTTENVTSAEGEGVALLMGTGDGSSTGMEVAENTEQPVTRSETSVS
jgi:hypothetical protein